VLVEGGQTVHPLVQVGDLRLEIADGRVDRVETVMDWARKNDVDEEAVQALLRFFGSDENDPNRDWRLSAQPPVIGRAARVAARARGEQLDERLGAAHSASLLRAFEGANSRLVVLVEAHAWDCSAGSERLCQNWLAIRAYIASLAKCSCFYRNRLDRGAGSTPRCRVSLWRVIQPKWQ
jgi:hypothetical protein